MSRPFYWKIKVGAQKIKGKIRNWDGLLFQKSRWRQFSRSEAYSPLLHFWNPRMEMSSMSKPFNGNFLLITLEICSFTGRHCHHYCCCRSLNLPRPHLSSVWASTLALLPFIPSSVSHIDGIQVGDYSLSNSNFVKPSLPSSICLTSYLCVPYFWWFDEKVLFLLNLHLGHSFVLLEIAHSTITKKVSSTNQSTRTRASIDLLLARFVQPFTLLFIYRRQNCILYHFFEQFYIWAML